LRGGVQAETGVLAKQGFGGEVTFGAGEFHAIGEGLAQVFAAFKGQHVETGFDVAHTQGVPAMIEKNPRQYAGSHSLYSWTRKPRE